MDGIIAANKETTSWVVGGQGVNMQQIIKGSLNFVAKAWWQLSRNRLCPTTGDSVLSPVHTLIAKITIGYDFNVEKFISREIHNWAAGTNVVLAFPFILTQICLEDCVFELPNVDHFIKPKNITDLGLICDTANPISK